MNCTKSLDTLLPCRHLHFRHLRCSPAACLFVSNTILALFGWLWHPHRADGRPIWDYWSSSLRLSRISNIKWRWNGGDWIKSFRGVQQARSQVCRQCGESRSKSGPAGNGRRAQVHLQHSWDKGWAQASGLTCSFWHNGTGCTSGSPGGGCSG